MKLLDSLLDAIVRLEGDALVMHVGEKPYVVTASSSMNAYRGPLAWGQVELSSRVLTFDAVSSMLVQILPADQQQALTEFGAIEHEIPSPAGVADRFTVIAARGGEDVWLEVRRRPIEIPQAAERPRRSRTRCPGACAEPKRKPWKRAPRVEPSVEPLAEPATDAYAALSTALDPQEIELVADAQAHVDEQARAEVQPEAFDSIVVEIPGQDAEEIELDDVPDNAIQIIDDEPQGVPTEEEVDAMLGATAAALLTSGLGDERRARGLDQIELDAPAVEEATPVVLSTAVPDVAGGVDVSVAEPGFELSPPPLLARVDDQALEDAEVIAETPLGTPLFSDEAVLAAAAPPVPEAAVEEAPVHDDVPVVAGAPAVEDTTVAEPLECRRGSDCGTAAGCRARAIRRDVAGG